MFTRKEIEGNKVYEQRFENNRLEYYVMLNGCQCWSWVYLKNNRMKLVD